MHPLHLPAGAHGHNAHKLYTLHSIGQCQTVNVAYLVPLNDVYVHNSASTAAAEIITSCVTIVTVNVC